MESEPSRSSHPPESPAGAGRPPPRSPPTILAGGSEDHRRLLRGLLLLHHQPVAFEAASLRDVPPPAPDTGSRILVYVAPAEDERWSEELRGTLAGRPDLRALVLVPLDEPEIRSSAARAGAQAVLGRPYTSRDFLEALDRLALPSSPPSVASTAGRRPMPSARLP